MTDKLTSRLFDFIESSPTACHTVNAVRALLLNAGFTELPETGPWESWISMGSDHILMRWSSARR